MWPLGPSQGKLFYLWQLSYFTSSTWVLTINYHIPYIYTLSSQVYLSLRSWSLKAQLSFNIKPTSGHVNHPTPQYTTMNYTLMLPLDFKSKFPKNYLVNQGDFGIRLTFVLTYLRPFKATYLIWSLNFNSPASKISCFHSSH